MYQFPLTIYVPTQTAGDDADHDVALPAFKCRIISASFAPSAATAANGTNYASLLIESHDGAGGAASAHTDALTTASTANAVGTSRAFTVSADTLPAGGAVRFAKTTAGTGAAVAGVVTLMLQAVV